MLAREPSSSPNEASLWDPRLVHLSVETIGRSSCARMQPANRQGADTMAEFEQFALDPAVACRCREPCHGVWDHIRVPAGASELPPAALWVPRTVSPESARGLVPVDDRLRDAARSLTW